MLKSALALALATALSLPAGVQAGPAPRPDFTGLWLLETEGRVVPKDAEEALTPLGKAQMAERTAQIAAGFPQNELHVKCLPPGMPQMMTAPFAVQVMQSSDRVVVNAKVSNLPRTIFLGVEHPEDVDPSWNGHSVGEWQGDVLVIDTLGLNDEPAFAFNFDPPVRRSDKMRVVERWTLEDGGKTLVDRMTLTDPKVFVRPVTVTYRYARRPASEGLMEKVCEIDAKHLEAFEAAYPRPPKYKQPF